MTYPQQHQQYPPQGYPQYPQHAMPPTQGYPQVPPPSGYPQQQVAPSGGVITAPAPVIDPNNPFSAPAAGGSVSPRARHLVGRTIAIEPVSVDEAATYQGQPRPSATFHLWIMDGQWPLMFGDNQDTGSPATHRLDGPTRFTSVVSSNAAFVREVRAKLGKGIALGVVERGTKNPRSFIITSETEDLNGRPRPDGAQRNANALALYQGFHNGTWKPTEPVELNPQQGQPQYAQPQYAPQQQPQQQYAPQGQPQYAPQGQPQYAPQQQPQQQYAPQQQPQYAPQQQPHVPQIQPPAPAANPNKAPAGWAQEAWDLFSPEQRQGILDRMSAQQAPPGI